VTQGEVPAVCPVDAAQPWSQQVAVALAPVLALVGDVADDLASPAQRVALAQALGVLAQTLRAEAQAEGAADTVAALAGMVFDAAIWRRAETQALWLSLLEWSLPDAR
jgi:hypothetical protein